MPSNYTLLDRDRLNDIVNTIQAKLAQPEIRSLNNRAVQAKIWQDLKVSSMMTELRQQEELVRQKIMSKVSYLVYAFHTHSIDATLARAGILSDDRIHAGSSLDKKFKLKNTTKVKISAEEFDLFCLDCKERLYLILKEYDWMKDFFRFHPQHFYENSFQFIHNIPPKQLPVKVKVVGLGIGGSLAVSGLKKRGIQYVIGYDKRARNGPRSVTSRFQNASWRAYDIAETLLDDEAFRHLAEYQQRIHVRLEDGATKILTADRVQIILGDAIHSALESAERYGADLRFDCDAIQACNGDDIDTDITAFFTGAHTGELVPGLKEMMHMHSWEGLNSPCKLWLEIKMSEKREAFTTRNIEVGAEKWHFSIESARNTKEDVIRIRDNIIARHHWNLERLKKKNIENEEEMEIAEENNFQIQLGKVDALLGSLDCDSFGEHKEETGATITEAPRFDYIFTNAPDNEHNRSKLKAAYEKGDVVIEGKYEVDVKIASRSMIDGSVDVESNGCDDQGKRQELLRKYNTNVIVTGGDACVPPNPMAAYGATLACEFAGMLVQLAVAHGHINAMQEGLSMVDEDEIGKDKCNPEWTACLEELKGFFNEFYDARGRSENYFQWMQTLLCNLYSLPPMPMPSGSQ